MDNKRIRTYAFWVVFTEGAGLLSGLLTKDGAKLYADTAAKPPLSPPSIVFPIAWGILYLLIALAAARVDLCTKSPARTLGLRLWAAQFAVNFLWPVFFFNLRAYGFSLFWLLLLLALSVWTALTFRKIDRVSALLFVPYLLWLGFAVYLNTGVWVLNR